MKKVGILFGMENTFPGALVAKINEMNAGVIAEFVDVGASRMADPAKYVDWIYMRPSETFKDRVWDALQDSSKLSGFVKVYELDGVSIYVSRAHYDEWMSARQHSDSG